MIRRRLHARPERPARRPFGAPVLEVDAVSAVRGRRAVLSDVHLSVAAGEVVVLVGPNGAGKSSLLAAVSGDLSITGGSIRVDGRPAGSWTPPELALRRAVLPQHSAVAFPFTGREVVHMARAPWTGIKTGLDDDPDHDESCVVQALADADALHLADRAVTTLSGGERARISLARLLAQRAQLLLLDEPTAALDLGHQELVMQCVRERARAGDAIVVVVHDLSLAGAYADRVVVVAGGSVAADGPPSEVLRRELIESVYEHPVDVMADPRSGAPIVVPVRAGTARMGLA